MSRKVRSSRAKFRQGEIEHHDVLAQLDRELEGGRKEEQRLAGGLELVPELLDQADDTRIAKVG